ncbi:MAG: hypothetical protein ACRBN8_30390 [Nannocystales bacterium]
MKADDIRIPKPCNEDWGRMTPEQRGRFCGACQKKVHDLSAMSEAEAKGVLDSQGDICVSYLSDESGVVQFQPDRIVPVGRLFRRASATAAAGLSLALAACAPHGKGPEIDDAETEQPAFLEVHPSIPDAEPCDAAPPEEMIRTLGAPIAVPEELIRTKGDYAPPPPEPTPTQSVRKKGTRKRTAGKPIPKGSRDPLGGL